ncbi:MAG TPA: nucleotidyltransferase domain-containing protein [Kofleriaceae bacterium]|nr:nucleotidyltransferase domain-containing protein [Kofleriaceae bacterium]
MVARLLPVFDPTPSSVAEIAKRLPAHQRAYIEWFPHALRSAFIEPLAHAPRDEFHVRLDELTGAAVRAVLQLVANLGELMTRLTPEAIARAIAQGAPRRAWGDLIRQHLEPIDVAAADDLREACEWLHVILSATAITLGPAVQRVDVAAIAPAAVQLETISDADIQRALRGDVRAFFHGLLLTIAALDVLERAALPDNIVEWCALALTELHATANMFRASGMPIPTDVLVPGYSPAAWRERRHRQGARVVPALLDVLSRGDVCPPGVLERIIEVMRPEEVWLFGSRARGTAGPDSDWDLLLVVPDTAAIPFDNDTWNELREVRRQQVDLVPIRRSDFEAERREFGTLAQIATASGRRIYER